MAGIVLIISQQNTMDKVTQNIKSSETLAHQNTTQSRTENKQRKGIYNTLEKRSTGVNIQTLVMVWH